MIVKSLSNCSVSEILFDGTFIDMNAPEFELDDPRQKARYGGLIACDERRPHDVLDGKSLTAFSKQQTTENSTFELST